MGIWNDMDGPHFGFLLRIQLVFRSIERCLLDNLLMMRGRLIAKSQVHLPKFIHYVFLFYIQLFANS